jgi:intracellular sulfur oxidation DsrE/DsrF family protein
MEISEAMKLLSNVVNTSTSLDQFKKIDLDLLPASEVGKYKFALAICQNAIKNGDITKEDFAKILDK